STGAERASPSGPSSADPTGGSPGGRTCRRREPPSAGFRFPSHRPPEFAPDFLGLAVVPPEVLEQLAPERVSSILLERHALGVELPSDVGKLDSLVRPGVADQALRVLARGEGGQILEELFAQERNPAVARAEVLFRAVGDRSLADPGDDVLVDDVAGDPAPSPILDRRSPRGDALLLVGLGLLRHA